MKKLISIVIALTMSFSLISCSGKTSESNSGSQSGSGSGQITIITPDKTNGKMGMKSWEKSRQDEFDAENPNIKVDRRVSATADPKKNVQAIINNLNNEMSAYTLLTANSYSYAKTVYQTGLTEDWSKYLTEEELSSFDPEIIEAFRSTDGAITGIPCSIEYPMLGFNRKHLRSEHVKEALGVDPSADNANEQVEAIIDNIKTWDDYYQVAKALSGTYAISGDVKTVSGYGGYLTDYYIGFGVWEASNGYSTAKQNADGTISFDLNNQCTIETLEFLQKMKREDIIKHDVYLEYTDFFGKIFSSEIASFIFYPSWSADWFEPNGIYASDVKVINIPMGPSIENLVERKKNGENVEVPKTNTCFAIAYVLNARASEEQKKAAVKYALYMYSKEAWTSKLEFAVEEVIPVVNCPPYILNDDYKNEYLYANVPEDWKASLNNSMANKYVFNYNSDGFISFINSLLPGIVKGSDGSGTYNTTDAIKARLNQMNTIVYNEWLTAYNNKVKK